MNLASINNEFKTLGNTVKESFGSAFGDFFSNISTGLFDTGANRQQAELEERLNAFNNAKNNIYAHEINEGEW